ncbi:MAG TPA: palindromic element RPE4 domain-containing protein [Rickettsia endosymbiont of Pyrocoelia pectoralis]|nr:palindromic element RPE4 domain-containing protein [Rickettsia endosymbiont of Pyrocoelia pectoralis]
MYSRDLVKNINIIDIFSCFLDTVDKPRYDTEGVFRAMQQRLRSLAMTISTFSRHCLKTLSLIYINSFRNLFRNYRSFTKLFNFLRL